MKIILLSGGKRSGKTTLCREIVKANPDAKHIELSACIRESLNPVSRHVFGLNIDKLPDSQKERLRPIMVKIGDLYEDEYGSLGAFFLQRYAGVFEDPAYETFLVDRAYKPQEVAVFRNLFGDAMEHVHLVRPGYDIGEETKNEGFFREYADDILTFTTVDDIKLYVREKYSLTY